MLNDDHILKSKRFDVKLYHDQLGQLGSGVLHFGGHQHAYVALEIFDPVPRQCENGTKFDLVKAVTDKGEIFSLCDCTFRVVALYADYVIEGDLEGLSFDAISVRYNDVSEWFLHWQTVSGQVGETLKWDKIPQDINVSIKTDKECFDLKSKLYRSRSRCGESLILHEYVEFAFLAKNKQFSFADVREKTNELSCLFSILLIWPASVISIVVSKKAGHSYQVYFPTFERPERDDNDHSFWIQCFIQQPVLDKQWQTIFNNYYESKYRKICWVRLAGMQRYSGFWEYKALGYVSLLDSYLHIRYDKEKFSEIQIPSIKKVNDFRQKISGEFPNLIALEKEKIVEIAKRSFSSDNFNFLSKYKKVIADTDVDVIKIINFTESDFKQIKKVRDKIAHGDDHGLKEDQFSRVVYTEAKITLLLTYWAFLDFGLTTQDFIACLQQTHNRLVAIAMIDKVHLARVMGDAEFFSVTTEKLRLLKTVKGLSVHASFIEDDGGDLIFSENFTKMYNDWLRKPDKEFGSADPEKIFGVSKRQARFVQEAYFECGDERLRVHHMWIIKNKEL